MFRGDVKKINLKKDSGFFYVVPVVKVMDLQLLGLPARSVTAAL